MTGVSLIITTFNWVEALEKSLQSVLVQSRRPDEIIIADDGSGIKTLQLVKKYQKIFEGQGLRLRHSWQPDKGFRLSRSRNLAISRARNEYIIMIDGDIIMSRHFIADHLAHAKTGCFIAGRRTKLSPSYSNSLLGTKLMPSAWSKGISRGREQAFRIPLLSKLFTKASANVKDIHGCNISFWREDALMVNGFNSAFEGWGAEDREFFQRLINMGRLKIKVKFSAVAFHIHHKENSRIMLEGNQKIYSDTLSQCLTWCKGGISEFANVTAYKPKHDKGVGRG